MVKVISKIKISNYNNYLTIDVDRIVNANIIYNPDTG